MKDPMSLDSPTFSIAEAHSLVSGELSTPARLRTVLWLFASSAMATITASLWATEPALPTRTRMAFGAMTLMGLAWAICFTQVLRNRRVLFAHHRVIAGRLAVAFTTIFTASAVAVAALVDPPQPAAPLAALLGAGMTAAAVVLLVQAHRRLRELRRLRDSLLGVEGSENRSRA